MFWSRRDSIWVHFWIPLVFYVCLAVWAGWAWPASIGRLGTTSGPGRFLNSGQGQHPEGQDGLARLARPGWSGPASPAGPTWSGWPGQPGLAGPRSLIWKPPGWAGKGPSCNTNNFLCQHIWSASLHVHPIPWLRNQYCLTRVLKCLNFQRGIKKLREAWELWTNFLLYNHIQLYI